MQLSMPERQHVDLHEAKRVDVVLVPLDDLPVVHRCGFDRHQLVEPVAGEHEAARVLRQVARRVDQLARELERESASRLSPRSMFSSSACFSSTPSRLKLQTDEARPAVMSSLRPSALPTSRTAPRAR